MRASSSYARTSRRDATACRLIEPRPTSVQATQRRHREAHDLALKPAPKDLRKVVLATSIAETSVTIEGVRVVIDSGLARVPRFEPDVGVTRLETVRVSRAAADQRRGRAGRTEPGVCFRLWDEPQTQGLPAFAEPEIRSADLTALLLACAEWGTTDPLLLSWIDPPAAAAVNTAREELTELEALDTRGRITAMGRRLRSLPLPPRLARMVIFAAERGQAKEAVEIAAVMVERGLGDNDPDLAYRLEGFRRDRSPRASEMRKLAIGWARLASAGSSAQEPREDMSIARMLALAFPERIGKSRGVPGQFLLANGRGANLDSTHPLARSPFLVAAELSGSAASTRVLLAAAAVDPTPVSETEHTANVQFSTKRRSDHGKPDQQNSPCDRRFARHWRRHCQAPGGRRRECGDYLQLFRRTRSTPLPLLLLSTRPSRPLAG